MTKDEALKQAMEAMEITGGFDIEINAIKEALAQPEQEPVAWGVFHFGGKRDRKLYSHCDTKEQAIAYIADRHQSDDTNTFRAAPLYITPPQRKPLTNEEIEALWDSTLSKDVGITALRKIARAIEAAHQIKGEA